MTQNAKQANLMEKWFSINYSYYPKDGTHVSELSSTSNFTLCESYCVLRI